VAPVVLVWTDNRLSMLSAKGNALGGYRLRLHHMFRQAPDAVWHALVAYIAHADVAARATLRAYIRGQCHLIRHSLQPQSHRRQLLSQGHTVNLETIYQELNQTYFANRIQAVITWMRRPPQRQRTSIRFGSYDEQRRLIRISRLLDQPFVPRYVVASVVFHEMLHQLIPRQWINGRWYVHPPAFRQHERRFLDYQRAQRWQQRHVARLLRG
jgi:hypothetical protein